ncbi:hypothetical protein ACP4OV_006382 [Aristida adscensionis]
MDAITTGTIFSPPAMLRRRRRSRTRRHPLLAQRRRHHGYLEPITACSLRRRQQGDEQEILISRIREKLRRGVDRRQPPSSYDNDTAWVAMVVPAAQGAPHAPRIPWYVQWIDLQDQHDDGSWSLAHRGHHLPALAKNAVSSTLACILALKKWNLGDDQIRKGHCTPGLCFIENSSSYILDEKCDAQTKAGFIIIFPGMIRLGIDLGLEFPLRQCDMDDIFRLQDMELQSRSTAEGRKAYMAHVAEGLGGLEDWDEVLAYQSRNGSLFNSPSATAAFAIHGRNANALKYLTSLTSKFGSSAPRVYPLNIYSQLSVVETLEKMGISHYFSGEINSILDTAYRSWLKNDEIVTDMETCAMAFRTLRTHGYDVSSDVLSRFAEESIFHHSVQGHINDTKALLQLYKASLIRILENEWVLDKISSWTSKLLKQLLCSGNLSGSEIHQEVEYALKFPFYTVTVEPLEHKRNIEHFSCTSGIQMQKSAYLACDAIQDILTLAVEEFNSSQALYQQELKCIESVRLEELKFARMIPMNIWIFMASAVFPTSELSNARVAWVKNTILTVVLDDFFDVGGSAEELENLVALIEKWDTDAGTGFCSERVEILFHAVYDTNNQIAAKAAEVQNRSVVHHIAEFVRPHLQASNPVPSSPSHSQIRICKIFLCMEWVNLARALMVEAEWTRRNHVPAMEEYMAVAETSYALGPILAASMCLLGPELSEDVVRGQEYRDLLRHASICGRLLNDLRTHEKESEHGYVNSVLLHAHRHGGSTSSSSSAAAIEAAKREVREAVVASQRELLRLVLSRESDVPRPCREVFWNTNKVSNLFYSQGDGFHALQQLVTLADAVVHEPLQVKLPSNCSGM